MHQVSHRNRWDAVTDEVMQKSVTKWQPQETGRTSHSGMFDVSTSAPASTVSLCWKFPIFSGWQKWKVRNGRKSRNGHRCQPILQENFALVSSVKKPPTMSNLEGKSSGFYTNVAVEHHFWVIYNDAGISTCTYLSFAYFWYIYIEQATWGWTQGNSRT